MLKTDGPFAEVKEHLGGFYLIEAEDLDAAVAWAARVTAAISVPIEVRPLAGFEAQRVGSSTALVSAFGVVLPISVSPPATRTVKKPAGGAH
ncbi:YciI family protein [Amycolatopsis sp. NPDC051716]|uniref:YciI family protein n=1 Tax=Amycolatopsis sp. NPDC051716 TaxID=3155804 RepID=UPI003422B4F1